MWQCPGCAEEIEDSFDTCWNCGTMPDGAKSAEFDDLAAEVGADRPAAGTRPTEPESGSLTRLELAQFVIRTLALWIFARAVLESVPLFLYFIAALMREEIDRSALPTVLTALPFGLIALAALLWQASAWLGRRLIAHPDWRLTNLNMNAESLGAIGFMIVGVYLLIQGLRSLTPIVVILAISLRESPEYFRSADFQSSLWSTLLTVLVGVWLLLGGRGVARFITRLRSPQG